MSALVVVSEVSVDAKYPRTRNRSLNEILIEYHKYFDTVHYIGPGAELMTCQPGLGGRILFSTLVEYQKPLRRRAHYLMKRRVVQRRFRQLIAETRPDLVQLRIPSVFALAAYPVVRELRLPITSYIAGDWYGSFIRNYDFLGNRIVGQLLEAFQRPVLSNSIRVTAGPALAKKYLKYGDCYPYFSTTHRGIIERACPCKPELLYVGRLEPLKRVEDAIKSLSLLLEKFPEAHLTIVGEGVQRRSLKQMAHSLGEGRVEFVGRVDDQSVLRDLYCKASFLLLPSLSEGTPKVLAEAMAHGTVPIAVAGVGSVGDIISDGINGILVPPENPYAIAERIAALLGNQEGFHKLRSGAYEYAKAHTLQAEVDKLWRYVFGRSSACAYS